MRAIVWIGGFACGFLLLVWVIAAISKPFIWWMIDAVDRCTRYRDDRKNYYLRKRIGR